MKRFKIDGLVPFRTDDPRKAALEATGLANVYGRPVVVEDRGMGLALEVAPAPRAGGDGAEGLHLPVGLQKYEDLTKRER